MSEQPLPASPPRLGVKKEDRVAFHMAEFSALKAEVAELVKVTSTNLQYALAASAGITTWLLSAKAPSERCGEKLLFPFGADQLRYAFLLPLLFSLAFGGLAPAAYGRIREKANYLKRLEGWLNTNGLGWERTFEQRRPLLGWL